MQLLFHWYCHPSTSRGHSWAVNSSKTFTNLSTSVSASAWPARKTQRKTAGVDRHE